MINRYNYDNEIDVLVNFRIRNKTFRICSFY